MLPMPRAWVLSLARELDPTCCNQDPAQAKKKMKLPYGLRIPLLGTYPDKTVIQKDTRTPMFTAALFITANMRKQPKRPSTSEQVNSVAHTRRGLPLSQGRECDSATCSNVGGPRDHHTKRGKSDRCTVQLCITST